VYSLRGAVARLRAEVLDQPVIFPAELKETPKLREVQQALYEKRRKALREDIDALQKTLMLAKQELTMNEPLLATGDISKADIIRLQRQVSEVETQIVTRRNRYFQDAQTELAQAEGELGSVVQTMTGRKDSLDHTELRAPMAGIVKNVRVTTVGASLKPSEELMEIVPGEDDLIIEVRIRPQDVGYLRPNLPATVKIDAYDGTLSYLSPDTITEDIKPNEQPYYRAQVRINGRRFSARPNEKIDIQPGMTATAEIRTGSNTVLKYLIKPVIKTLSESMHER
jgi:adhesin transport system membrane fusion protein